MVLDSELKTNNGMLCCPVCACCNLHIASVSVATHKTETTIDSTGTSIKEIHNRGRGSITTLLFECEGCGGIVKTELTFHKGCMLLTNQLVGNTEEDGWIPDIWRD